jgi:hypothetical protein
MSYPNSRFIMPYKLVNQESKLQFPDLKLSNSTNGTQFTSPVYRELHLRLSIKLSQPEIALRWNKMNK